MSENIRFTDGDGTPISWEAFESVGYTEGMKLEGQTLVQVKCKKGIMVLACRCETQEDFQKLGNLMWKGFIKENAIQ